jgi:hypothetical protein
VSTSQAILKGKQWKSLRSAPASKVKKGVDQPSDFERQTVKVAQELGWKFVSEEYRCPTNCFTTITQRTSAATSSAAVIVRVQGSASFLPNFVGMLQKSALDKFKNTCPSKSSKPSALHSSNTSQLKKQ